MLFRRLIIAGLALLCLACKKKEDAPDIVLGFDKEQCAVTLEGEGIKDRVLPNWSDGATYTMQVAYYPLFDGNVYTTVSYSGKDLIDISMDNVDSVRVKGEKYFLYFSRPVTGNQAYTRKLNFRFTGKETVSSWVYGIQVNSLLASPQWEYVRQTKNDSTAYHQGKFVRDVLMDKLSVSPYVESYSCPYCYFVK